MSEIDEVNELINKVQYHWNDATRKRAADAIRAHVEGLEQQLADERLLTARLSAGYGHDYCHDIVCNGDRSLPRGYKPSICSCDYRDRMMLPPGVTLEEVRGVLEKVANWRKQFHKALPCVIVLDKLQEPAAALLAKLTAQPAANGKDEGE